MKRFPVLWPDRHVALARELGLPRSVPWEAVEPGREQALRNHDQTLERLAERGGMSPLELMCALTGRGLRCLLGKERPTNTEAIEFVKGLNRMMLAELGPQIIDSVVPPRRGVGLLCGCPCGCDHMLYVPFANPLDGGGQFEDGPAWHRTGDTIETLTLRPSVNRVGHDESCGWHGRITNGEVTSC